MIIWWWSFSRRFMQIQLWNLVSAKLSPSWTSTLIEANVSVLHELPCKCACSYSLKSLHPSMSEIVWAVVSRNLGFFCISWFGHVRKQKLLAHRWICLQMHYYFQWDCSELVKPPFSDTPRDQSWLHISYYSMYMNIYIYIYIYIYIHIYIYYLCIYLYVDSTDGEVPGRWPFFAL